VLAGDIFKPPASTNASICTGGWLMSSVSIVHSPLAGEHLAPPCTTVLTSANCARQHAKFYVSAQIVGGLVSRTLTTVKKIKTRPFYTPSDPTEAPRQQRCHPCFFVDRESAACAQACGWRRLKTIVASGLIGLDF
jgi:hypothetical protein